MYKNLNSKQYTIDSQIGQLSHLFSPPTLSLDQLQNNNFEQLTTIIRKLVQLKKEGDINEDELTSLITFACSNFVENEITLRMNKVLDGFFEEHLSHGRK